MDIEQLNIKWDAQGLIPAIIQNASTGKVLMLGYMNESSLKQTLSTGLVTFYSRSRQTLWVKGETSGNTLSLVSMELDCDGDALLVKADPAGPTCHTGEESCFYQALTEIATEKKRALQSEHTLAKLMDTVLERKENPQTGSYTNYLIEKGMGKILKKVGEESSEIIIAALSEDDESLIGEVGDLLYHLTVMLAVRGLSWQEILELLDARAASK